MLAEPFQFASAVQQARHSGGSAAPRLFSLRRHGNQETLCPADSEDIRDTRNGDPEAYRRLIERHQSAVGKLLWRFTRDRNDHEELVQQVFVEVYMSLDNYAGKAPFEHWLARIATRVGYRFWNRHKRTRTVAVPDEQWNQLVQTQNDSMDSSEAAELVHRLLAQLPPRDRLILTLRYLEQCDIAQTAYRLGWTQTRVRVQAHRAIQKLKKIVADNHIELEL